MTNRGGEINTWHAFLSDKVDQKAPEHSTSAVGAVTCVIATQVSFDIRLNEHSDL